MTNMVHRGDYNYIFFKAKLVNSTNIIYSKYD